MRLVFLIGWPGVGKTTVGAALAERTGFLLLDNHLTYREICHFLPRGTPAAHLLNIRLRRAILKMLFCSPVPGVFLTLSIRRHPITRATSYCVRMAKRQGARVDFVKLVCDWSEHRRRVRMPSRHRFTKTYTIRELKEKMARPSFLGLASHPPLVIDNTHLTPGQCAERIITSLKLPRQQGWRRSPTSRPV